MKTTFLPFIAILAFGFVLSCGDQNEISPDMKIVTVLQSEDWGNTGRAVALVENYAKKTGLEVTINRIVIRTPEEAQDHNFIGSPTVRINGLDVDPFVRAETTFGFTWRLMDWTQGASAPEKLLHDAFVEAGWTE